MIIVYTFEKTTLASFIASDEERRDGHSIGRSATRQTESETCTRPIYRQSKAVSRNGMLYLKFLACNVPQLQ